MQLCFRNFLNFRLNVLYFVNSTAFEISAALPNFRKFWLSLKCCFVLVCGSQANSFTLLQDFFVSGLEIMQP